MMSFNKRCAKKDENTNLVIHKKAWYGWTLCFSCSFFINIFFPLLGMSIRQNSQGCYIQAVYFYTVCPTCNTNEFPKQIKKKSYEVPHIQAPQFTQSWLLQTCTGHWKPQMALIVMQSSEPAALQLSWVSHQLFDVGLSTKQRKQHSEDTLTSHRLAGVLCSPPCPFCSPLCYQQSSGSEGAGQEQHARSPGNQHWCSSQATPSWEVTPHPPGCLHFPQVTTAGHLEEVLNWRNRPMACEKDDSPGSVALVSKKQAPVERHFPLWYRIGASQMQMTKFQPSWKHHPSLLSKQVRPTPELNPLRFEGEFQFTLLIHWIWYFALAACLEKFNFIKIAHDNQGQQTLRTFN